jgi:sugar lactone lactonase YvrE
MSKNQSENCLQSWGQAHFTATTPQNESDPAGIRKFVAAISLILLCCTASVAAERVVLVAGGDKPLDGSLPAIEAKLSGPFAICESAAGDYYICELEGQRVLKVDRLGMLTRIAGDGRKGSAGDGGPALSAQFNGMHHLAIGGDGLVYLADTWNNRIRRVDLASGVIAPFAGTGQEGFSGDGGPAAKARFGGIYCLAFGPAGKKLYVADLDNRRIRAIDVASGVVSTLAGNGQSGTPADGARASESPLVAPRAVAADGEGNVYILERGGHSLRVVDREGKIRTLAGTGKPGPPTEGDNPRAATFNGPKHLCVDRNGDVIIADTENHVIRKYLVREAKLVRVAGCGRRGSAGIGGPPLEIELNQPHGVMVDHAGVLYIADSSNNRVLKIVAE